jgi:hypothetical protein
MRKIKGSKAKSPILLTWAQIATWDAKTLRKHMLNPKTRAEIERIAEERQMKSRAAMDVVHGLRALHYFKVIDLGEIHRDLLTKLYWVEETLYGLNDGESIITKNKESIGEKHT